MKRMLAPALLAIFLALVLVATWGSGAARAADGKAVYESKCLICHGATGDGEGPQAKLLQTKPRKFTDPKFWQGDANQKISQCITMGKGLMRKMDLSPDEIKAVCAYISQKFKP